MAKNPKILESVYSIRDIQIFGAGSRRMKEVDEANRNGGKDNIAIVLVEPQISEVKL